MKNQILNRMHKTLKQLLIIVIIPTIVWGTTIYLLYRYWQMIIQDLSKLSSTEIVFPFWVGLLILLIVYIGAMLLLYVLVKKEEIDKIWENRSRRFTCKQK